MAGVTPAAALDAVFATMREPFEWGMRGDCTAACMTFWLLHGTDPLMTCTDQYTDAKEAARILYRAGGYLDWCKSTFDLPETDEPEAGDMALIESADHFGAALAICINRGEFAAKTETGIAITRAKVLGAWTCRF